MISYLVENSNLLSKEEDEEEARSSKLHTCATSSGIHRTFNVIFLLSPPLGPLEIRSLVPKRSLTSLVLPSLRVLHKKERKEEEEETLREREERLSLSF